MGRFACRRTENKLVKDKTDEQPDKIEPLK
jgi:hypothetical protein